MEPVICTAENPWNSSRGTHAVHPDAVDDGECSNSCCDYFLCPHCKLRFRVEVGQ